jgi:hypothetical protein
MASTTSERKDVKDLKGMSAWGRHEYAKPLSLRLKVAEYQGFHMRFIFYCASMGSVRN